MVKTSLINIQVTWYKILAHGIIVLAQLTYKKRTDLTWEATVSVQCFSYPTTGVNPAQAISTSSPGRQWSAASDKPYTINWITDGLNRSRFELITMWRVWCRSTYEPSDLRALFCPLSLYNMFVSRRRNACALNPIVTLNDGDDFDEKRNEKHRDSSMEPCVVYTPVVTLV